MKLEPYRGAIRGLMLVGTTRDPLHCLCPGCGLFRALAQAIFGWMEEA